MYSYLHPRWIASKTLVRVSSTILETTETEFTELDLTNLLRYASPAQKNNFIANLPKHIGLQSTYALKKELIKYLIIISKALNDQIPKLTITENDKSAILCKLDEELQNCTPGFFIRTKMVMGLLARPETLDELFAQYRLQLAVKASYGFREVHAHQKFIAIANSVGLAVSVDDFIDPHQSRVTVADISEKLSKQFLLEHSPAALVSDVLADQLYTLGYIGANEEYKAEIYEPILIWFRKIFSDTELSYTDIFVLHEAKIVDVDWKKINTLLVQKLEAHYLEPMLNPIGVSWQHNSENQIGHRLTLEYHPGDLGNGLLHLKISSPEETQYYCSYLGAKNGLIDELPEPIVLEVLITIHKALQNLEEYRVLTALSTVVNQRLFELLFDGMISKIHKPKDFVVIAAFLNARQCARLYVAVKETILPLVRSLDHFCDVLAYLTPQESSQFCRMLVFKNVDEVAQLFSPLNPEQCATLAKNFKNRIARMLYTSASVDRLFQYLSSGQVNAIFPILKEGIVKAMHIDPFGAVRNLNPEHLQLLKNELIPKHFNEEHLLHEILEDFQGERLRVMLSLWQTRHTEPMTVWLMRKCFSFLDEESFKIFNEVFQQDIQLLIINVEAFSTATLFLEKECTYTLYQRTKTILDPQIIDAKSYALVADNLSVKGQIAFFECHRDKIVSFIKQASDVSTLLLCMTIPHRTVIYELIKTKLPELIHSANDFNEVLKPLTCQQRESLIQINWSRLFSFIDNVSRMHYVMEVLSSTEQSMLLDKIGHPKLATFPDVVKNFKMACIYLSVQERTSVIKQMPCGFYEFNGYDIHRAISLLDAEGQRVLLDAAEDTVKGHVKSDLGFLEWIAILAEENYPRFCDIVSEQLPRMFNAKHVDSTCFYIFHLATYVRACTLNSKQLKAIFPLLMTRLDGFSLNSDAVVHRIKLINRLSDIEVLLTLFGKENIRATPYAIWVDLISGLGVYEGRIVKSLLQEDLFERIVDIDSFSQIYRILDQTLKNKIFVWLYMNIFNVIQDATLSEIARMLKVLEAGKQTIVFEKIKSLILNLIRHANDVMTIAPVLNEKQALYVLRAVNLNELFSAQEHFSLATQHLSPVLCQVVLDKLEQPMRAFILNAAQFVAVIKDKDPLHAHYIIQQLDIDALLPTVTDVALCLSYLNPKNIAAICEDLSLLIKKRISSAVHVGLVASFVNGDCLPIFFYIFREHFFHLIQNTQDVADLLYRSSVVNVICVEMGSRIDEVVQQHADVIAVLQKLNIESHWRFFCFAEFQIPVSSVAYAAQLMKHFDEGYRTTLMLHLNLFEKLETVADFVEIIPVLSDEEATKAIANKMKLRPESDQYSFVTDIMTQLPHESRERMFNKLIGCGAQSQTFGLFFSLRGVTPHSSERDKLIACAVENPSCFTAQSIYRQGFGI